MKGEGSLFSFITGSLVLIQKYNNLMSLNYFALLLP
jgi:hypothetical protein